MTSWPSARTRPLVGVTMPQMTLMSVVFPAPFGPSRAKISSRRISRLTLFSAWNPDGNVLTRFETEMAGRTRPIYIAAGRGAEIDSRCGEQLSAHSPLLAMLGRPVHQL